MPQKFNFFKIQCQKTTNEKEFGICDDKDDEPAYLEFIDKKKWIASIDNNSNGQLVTFTAVDKCIKILRSNGDEESSCDAMLTYTDNIIFIELKDVRGGWISGAIEQLKTTIDVFRKNHNIYQFRYRRAFACNRAHPNFVFSHKEQMKKFKTQTDVLLIIEARIKL